MWLRELTRIAAVLLLGAVVGGSILHAGPRAIQGEKGRPDRPQAEVGRRIEMPAPRGLKVASGRGKILIYELDEKGERIRSRAGDRNAPFREMQREIRWAVVTGLIDHDQVQKSLIMEPPQPPPPAERLYCRVELERQTLRQDGTWSGWVPADAEATLRILDNVPELEEERVAPEHRVVSLVDPLPFLTVGKWRGVDVVELIPAQRKEILLDQPVAGSNPTVPALGLRRDRPPALMIRSFDFAVEPGWTYRYRARVMLFNPAFNQAGRRQDRFIPGPWSVATEIVTIPSP